MKSNIITNPDQLLAARGDKKSAGVHSMPALARARGGINFLSQKPVSSCEIEVIVQLQSTAGRIKEVRQVCT